ncbi:hypothetical protein KGV52_00410 [Candidatus Gracilibacteria bacterium]|nr:hypothetical protein [Candidatus Gracilibacteria bacterium]
MTNILQKQIKMKTILVVSALSQEGKVIKNILKQFQKKDIKILYLSTGMGNYKMILELTKFLEQHTQIDFLLNIGVCGKKQMEKKYLNIARIVNIYTKKELIVPQLLGYKNMNSIVCSERIVTNSDVLEDEHFVDMESYGFEMVAENYKLPRAIFKVPVDEIGEETKNFDFKNALKKLEENIDYEELLEKIQTYLEKKSEKQTDFSKYFSHYAFTFSQKEQFKKLFFEYETMLKNDFEAYFLEHNQKSKKQFLQDLQTYLQNYKTNII